LKYPRGGRRPESTVAELLWDGRGDPSRGAHNPDSCWPLQGCTLVAEGNTLVRPDGSAATVPASVRRYRLPKGGEQMLMYWGQLGPLVLSPEGDTRDAPALMAELLTGRRRLTDRTEVFVSAAADVTGDPAAVRADLERLCGRAAGDLYAVWPGVAVAPAGPGR
jgi:hypothetical protein